MLITSRLLAQKDYSESLIMKYFEATLDEHVYEELEQMDTGAEAECHVVNELSLIVFTCTAFTIIAKITAITTYWFTDIQLKTSEGILVGIMWSFLINIVGPIAVVALYLTGEKCLLHFDV